MNTFKQSPNSKKILALSQLSVRKKNIFRLSLLLPAIVWFLVGWQAASIHGAKFSLPIALSCSALILLVDYILMMTTFVHVEGKNSPWFKIQKISFFGIRLLVAVCMSYLGAIYLEALIFRNELTPKYQEIADSTALEDFNRFKNSPRFEEVGKNKLSLDSLKNEEYRLQIELFKEMDGQSPSKQVGYKKIAKRKDEELKKVQEKINQLQSTIDSTDQALALAKDSIDSVYSSLAKHPGILYVMKALASLQKESNEVRNGSFIMMALLFFLELIPLILKITSPKSAYDTYLESQEHVLFNRLMLEKEREIYFLKENLKSFEKIK